MTNSVEFMHTELFCYNFLIWKTNIIKCHLKVLYGGVFRNCKPTGIKTSPELNFWNSKHNSRESRSPWYVIVGISRPTSIPVNVKTREIQIHNLNTCVEII